MPPRRGRVFGWIVVVLACVFAGGTGCVVVKPVVGAGAAVGGAAVKTTAKATVKAAGAVADAVVPDGEEPQQETPAER